MAKKKPINWKNRIVRHGEQPASQFTANALNFRRHPNQQREALRGSLSELGWIQSVVVNKTTGNVIDGHARIEEALSLDEHSLVPFVEVEISEAEEKLALATFDPISAMATADKEVLDILLHEVSTGSAALQQLMSDLAAREGLYLTDEPTMPGVGGDTEPQVDEAAELNKKWKVKNGDCWQIGQHRLYCANSLSIAPETWRDCQSLFYDPEWDKMEKPLGQWEAVLAFADGQRVGDLVSIFGSPTWLFVWDCVTSWYAPNRPLKRMKLCAWYGDVNSYNFDGYHYGEPLEAKTVTNTRGSYDYKPDPRGKHLSDVFQMPITQAHADGMHSHSKPVDWITMLLANCTKGAIYDPFAGSGAAMVAAERLSRACVSVEVKPENCAIILERMATDFPGLKIVRRSPVSRSAGSRSRRAKTVASPA